MELSDVTVETFAGREGQRFWIRFSDGTLELTLAAVEGQPEHWGSTEAREPFSITFHGPLEHVLPPRIWPVEHEELGRLEMFVVPIGPEADAMRYQAVFS